MSKIRHGLCAALVGLMTAAPALGIRIDPNDDCSVRNGVNKNNDSGIFGLIVKNTTDAAYLEFTLGNVAATQAKLVLYEAYGTASNFWDVVVRHAEYNFNEATIKDHSLGKSWPILGNIPNVKTTGRYELDLTDWYNANLGKTMSLHLYRSSQPSGDGVIFEDKEGTLTGDALTNGPRIEWVPEPTSLALLGAGSLLLVRRRRA